MTRINCLDTLANVDGADVPINLVFTMHACNALTSAPMPFKSMMQHNLPVDQQQGWQPYCRFLTVNKHVTICHFLSNVDLHSVTLSMSTTLGMSSS